jgi:hypothetical protein
MTKCTSQPQRRCRPDTKPASRMATPLPSRAGAGDTLAALQARAGDAPSVCSLRALQLRAEARGSQRVADEEELLQGRFSAAPLIHGTTTIQRVMIDRVEVEPSGGMPTWDQGGHTYHLNLTTETKHVTREGNPKIHYFFDGYGEEIRDKQPTPEERGPVVKVNKQNVKTSTVFSHLPEEVQNFVRRNYTAILNVGR